MNAIDIVVIVPLSSVMVNSNRKLNGQQLELELKREWALKNEIFMWQTQVEC